MGMTLDDFETKALQVLLSQRFINFPLFEEEELSNYEVSDIQGSMPFDDFIRQYAEIIMEQVKATYEQRLKADLVAMLTDIQLEIEEIKPLEPTDDEDWQYGCFHGLELMQDKCLKLIQQKINSLEEA